MRLSLVLAVGGISALWSTACGDDDQDPVFVAEQLRALPGVHSVEQRETLTTGYQYYVLHFKQPVDHDDPRGPTFLQKVSLLHKDTASPLVEFTSGYWEYYKDQPVELTRLLDANQVSIEHRYFDESRPDPADWSKLTIAQMAHDQHAINRALRMFYDGAVISAGASKGGMTAIYHRRFYPDDVDGTVAYVAPISFGAPDARYVPFLDTLGPAGCRQAVRAVATEMLANRRAVLTAKAAEQAAAAGFAYTRIALGPAVESAIFHRVWSFWQYNGIDFCDAVPAPSAADDELFEFLTSVSPVSDSADGRIAQFEAYYYQAYSELGYPDGGAAYLDPYLQYTEADYLNALPTTQPTYDGGAAMADIDQYVKEAGDRFIFIYGEWDPWTGGRFELGAATDSMLLTEEEGTHAAHITALSAVDQEAVFAKLELWTGVRPQLPGAARTSAPRFDMREPRVPPAILRALSLLSPRR